MARYLVQKEQDQAAAAKVMGCLEIYTGLLLY